MSIRPPSQSGTSVTAMRGAAATTDMISMGVTADATDRFVVNADGKLEWGDGAASTDTNLYRSAANALKSDDDFLLSTDGSAFATPRVLGFTDFNGSESARFQFGDSANSLQNGFAGKMQLTSYHEMEIRGGGAGAVPTMATGVGTAPSVSVIATSTTRAAFAVRLAATPTGDALQVLASDGTTLMGGFSKDGAIRSNSGAYAGATATGGTIAYGTGAPNNANGTNGDLYVRVDGGALTTIYQRRAGAWVGIV